MTRIYVGIQGALLVADEATGWERVDTHFDGSTVESVVLDPANPGRVYVGLYSGQEGRGELDRATAGGLRGVWRSDDGGATWRDCSAGLASPATVSLAVRGAAGGFDTVYAGTEPSVLYRSHDGGATWHSCGDLTALPSSTEWAFPPRPNTHHVRWIGLDPVEPDRLYLCIEAGAFISSADGGNTWRDRTPDGPIDTHTLATHPLVPGRLYSAAGDGFLAEGRGYAESPDRGETWVRFGDGLRHHYLYGLAVDSADPNTVVVSAASSPFQAHSPAGAESHVYRRTGGGPWEPAMAGLPPAEGLVIPILTAHPTRGGVFFAACNHGVFRSGDAGRTWQPLPIPWQPEYRARHVQALAVAD